MRTYVKLDSDLELNNPFWDFSVSLWQSEKAQRGLLNLQNKYGLRVNLLLLASWLGLRKQSFASMHNALDTDLRLAWQDDYVSPLRKLRLQLPKTDLVNTFKSKLQAAELEAERIEHALLFELSQKNAKAVIGKNTLEVLGNNLHACIDYQKPASPLPEIDELSGLIEACLPTYPLERINTSIAEFRP